MFLIAFAQLLQDKAFMRSLEEKTRLRDEYGVYADDPAGLPATDPFLALTAAGDAEGAYYGEGGERPPAAGEQDDAEII